MAGAFARQRAARSLGLATVVASLWLVACAPGAPPASAPAAQGGAAASPAGSAEIATYRGADRQQRLEEGARREGKLVWYTALIVNQAVRPLVDGFREKYPFIEVEFWRGNSTDIIQRVVQEYQGNRFEVDLADGTTTPPFLRERGYAQPFYSPPLEEYPAALKDKDGYWATANLYFMTLGYNTQLVSRQDVPKTYQDLLNPRWKGKLAWSTSAGTGGPGFVGNILDTMGQEQGMAYLNQLARQDIRNLDVSARAVLDQAIAGEFPIAVQIFNHHTVISAASGAPVDWQPLEPVTAQLQVSSLVSKAPHPHAAMLFLDFLLSADGGQRILREVDYLPSHPKVEAKVPSLKPEQGGFKTNYIGPERAYEQDREWQQIFDDLFIH
jgi:iron(III) transport system substrate-binding protein